MAKRSFTLLTFEVLRIVGNSAKMSNGILPKSIFRLASWNAVYSTLGFLEKEKLITRKKAGRNKIIVLTEKGKIVFAGWYTVVRTVGVEKLGRA